MEPTDIRVAAARFIAAGMPVARRHSCDVLVIGGGAAGLAAALRAAASAEVTVLARGQLRESNSAWAQGGIAAALDGDDRPELHVADTLVAGAGLCDLPAVEALAHAAPALMHELAGLGVPFEQHGGDFALGLEGGHGMRRILHVGDTTGWAITSALIRHALAHPRIRVLEGFQALDLLTSADHLPQRTQSAPRATASGAALATNAYRWHDAERTACSSETSVTAVAESGCTGVLALDDAGRLHRFEARAMVLASGGAGALYGLTSNQPTALGEGIAMAYRAGAELADMEFVQFHPTVYRTALGAGFLISEATRGEGGILHSPAGERFMPAYDRRAELAPRDVVTRGIYAAMRREGADHVLLDLTGLGRELLERRFPTIVARCRADGLDPAERPIPVAPAAHYLMGGVRTDLRGATSIPGLFAAGECACTGVHGANRLASNSLLECLVFGRRAGEAAAENAKGQTLNAKQPHDNLVGARSDTASGPMALPPQDLLPPEVQTLTAIMRAHAGPLRDGAGLAAASRALAALEQSAQTPQLQNAILAARLIVAGALMRQESRGAHFRADLPRSEDAWRGHIVQRMGEAPRIVQSVAAPAELAEATV